MSPNARRLQPQSLPNLLRSEDSLSSIGSSEPNCEESSPPTSLRKIPKSKSEDNSSKEPSKTTAVSDRTKADPDEPNCEELSPPTSLHKIQKPKSEIYSSRKTYATTDFSDPDREFVRSNSCPNGRKLLSERYGNLHVPRLDNNAAMKRKKKRRRKRERKTAAGAVGGMVAGGIALGPIGVVVGAALGGFTVRKIAKKADKRNQRKKEQKSFRDYAKSKSTQWTQNGDAAVFT